MNYEYKIVWDVTNQCNEHCKFCFRKKCNDLSIVENKKIVDRLAKYNIKTLSLSGGEVLLYKDLFELVHYIRVKLPTTKLTLNTNGKIVTKELLEKIAREFDAITLPIDSTNNNYNEEIRKRLLS